MGHYKLIGDEILIACFNDFLKNKVLTFDEDEIMDAFNITSKDSKFAELLVNYNFDRDGIFPYSTEIADGLFQLQTSQLIALRGNHCFMTPGITERFRKFIEPKLDANQINLVHDLSKEIQKLLLLKKTTN